jgi:23S rRNA (adenine2030-N6)-methyltransferase
VNYRHHFHAGNFADVLKHAVLAWVIAYLKAKPSPICLIESHAGAGLYDLASEAALRTGEWREGVGRLEAPLAEAAEVPLAPYREALRLFRAAHGPLRYPGSPLLAQMLLRAEDRYVGAELHPRTFDELALAIGPDPRFRLQRVDGWQAARAATPPRERRGIVLIDPAFEAADEWTLAARELNRLRAKWPTGLVMLWYPLKNPRQADELTDAVAGQGQVKLLRLEVMVDDLASAERLAGCGLLIVNPPWTLHAAGEALLPALAERLARSGRAGYRCEALGPA